MVLKKRKFRENFSSADLILTLTRAIFHQQVKLSLKEAENVLKAPE